MFKHKVVFPTQTRLQSPYQLEDCKRRLGYLRHDNQPITFTPLDNNQIRFRVRRIKSGRIPSPVIAFEITGTLQRWGGTGTVIDRYQLRRFRAQVDTWVIILIALSVTVATMLMLPALLHINGSFQSLQGVFLLVAVVVGLPILTWIQHTLALDVDRDIDALHQSIMQALQIGD